MIQEQVNDEARLKLSGNLSARALSSIRTNYTQALLFAVESFRLLEGTHLVQGRYPDTVYSLLQDIPLELVQALPLSSTETVRKVLNAPDGNLLVTLGDSLEVWDTKIPAFAQRLKSWNSSSSSTPSDVAFHPDSKMMFIGYEDGKVVMWDIDTNSFRKRATLDVFPAEPRTQVKVAVSTDGNMLAVAGSELSNSLIFQTPIRPLR